MDAMGYNLPYPWQARRWKNLSSWPFPRVCPLEKPRYGSVSPRTNDVFHPPFPRLKWNRGWNGDESQFCYKDPNLELSVLDSFTTFHGPQFHTCGPIVDREFHLQLINFLESMHVNMILFKLGWLFKPKLPWLFVRFYQTHLLENWHISMLGQPPTAHVTLLLPVFLLLLHAADTLDKLAQQPPHPRWFRPYPCDDSWEIEDPFEPQKAPSDTFHEILLA